MYAGLEPIAERLRARLVRAMADADQTAFHHDQDAAVWPRRKCWVRDDERQPWEEAVLLSVTGDYSCPFRVLHESCKTDLPFRYCEIEVQE